MARQSISLTEPNAAWLKKQIEDNEYTSVTEAVNDLIRQARRQTEQIDRVRTLLIEAEESVRTRGHSGRTPAEIRDSVLKRKGLG